MDYTIQSSPIASTVHTGDGTGTGTRETWSSGMEFLLSCLGYAVGLGNVWRFPVQAYKNGGGVFFIPYWIMLVFLGMPVFLMELAIGQYSGAGPTACWNFCPLAQGVGFGMTLVSGLTAMYYNMIIAWCIYFLGASMTSELPWKKCDPKFTGRTCIDRVVLTTKEGCLDMGTPCEDGSCGNKTNCEEGNGVCKPASDIKSLIIWDTKLAHDNNCSVTFAAKEYFRNAVLGLDKNPTLEYPGEIELHLLGCYFLAWVIGTLCLMGGVKATGKVVYVTAIAPYLVLCVFFFRGITLEGFMIGLEFYLKPDFNKLFKPRVWQTAATQISFSLSTAYGGLIALASYNKFNNDIHRDTLIVTIGNCMTSVFAGFVVFSYLGHLAHVQGLDIDQLSEGGHDLVFGVYPFVLTLLPGPVVWSIILYIMLIMLGVDSQFVFHETVVTALADTFPRYLRQRKPHAVVGVSLALFLLGIPLTTSGGSLYVDFVDKYAGGWNVLFLGLFESLAVIRYGTSRLAQDVELMIGKKLTDFERNWWLWNWTLITPCLFSLVIIFSLWQILTEPPDEGRPISFMYDYVIGLGFITLSTSFVLPLAFAVYHVYRARGHGFKEKLQNASSPNHFWSPRYSIVAISPMEMETDGVQVITEPPTEPTTGHTTEPTTEPSSPAAEETPAEIPEEKVNPNPSWV